MRKILSLILALASLTVAAQSVKLTWDNNPEPDISGYGVYSATLPSTTFTLQNMAVTNLTTNSLVLNTITSFYVTAFNTSGLESLPSNIVRVNNYPLTAPVLSHQVLSSSSVRLTWPAATLHTNGETTTNTVYYAVSVNGTLSQTVTALEATVTGLSGPTVLSVTAHVNSTIKSTPATVNVNLTLPTTVTGLKILAN